METLDERLVADYAKITLFDVYEIDVFNFWFLLRESIIFFYSQTESGMDYLEKAWLLEQTEPDEKALERKYGGVNIGSE